ncbi:N-acetylmuramoyl-L-alanine amidase [Sphingobacterium yanglingense]|uniref:N-acetylmuramoyl-L-alanine amidase n=1 Tax=Sphingobacterium yanglingense TaxID=1437280 RepID=A0A4R6WHH7_9SPHI|nr:N-acetylmuramoyl-L-alanine amidase [Sphingobacterium yanglingense]TDQ79594.1 N-acetylmuramoyl-L-alanine amidase [Sphingobacterium yanglingense]
MANYISYSSAGHHLKDSGAIGVNGRQENHETISFRDMVNAELIKLGRTVVRDKDTETLGQYLGRINPTDKDVVVEPHFNAFNGKASGVEVLIADNANERSKAMAKELCDGYARIMGIPNRGVKTESQSARGKLGLMRKKGAVCLPELCFIDNPSDMAAYDRNKVNLACFTAQVMNKYDLN